MSIEDDITCLEAVPTFRLLGPNALRILAIGCESRALDEGEVLFEAGQAADCGYVIQDGSFQLEPVAAGDRPAGRGDDPLVMMVGPGVLLGELALIIDTARPVTATAAEPSTVIRVPRSLFLKMLEGFPDAARRLRDHIAARTNQATADMITVRSTLDPQRPRR